MIQVKRVYEPAVASDGQRLLVERLWPRGIRKESLQIDAWPKDVAPSPELRKWFAHDPAKWPEFRRRYFRELDAHPQGWRLILGAAAEGNRVTLIYSSHDREHNNAVALRDYLEKKHASRTRKLRKTA
ncbi:MAG TPA: DUF488 domain-containing protein [Acidobacteriaceae bacterium]|nr:DUF488 domain-containing protein [Acidobacteriaceae bacterium]